MAPKVVKLHKKNNLSNYDLLQQRFEVKLMLLSTMPRRVDLVSLIKNIRLDKKTSRVFFTYTLVARRLNRYLLCLTENILQMHSFNTSIEWIIRITRDRRTGFTDT